MLEHMGVKVLEQLEYKVEPEGTPPVYVHDFGMSHQETSSSMLAQVKSGFEEAFARAWRGEIENDDFNRLVLRANLGWREVTILRAYCKYLRQTGFTFSQAYMEQALSANAAIAKKLVELFVARFDPANTAEAGVKISALTAEIEKALDSVENLDEDRMLRRFLAVIQATLRTNYFQKDAGGATKPYISFKFNPALVPGLPEPKPMFEIYVYSPRVEGVHLRGGKVARGGLRWSDRMEDFRTEVLGLMKAQMVKNTVIVPVGSKGGFVVKQPPADREAFLKEGIACYQTFLRGLLDLTDNLVAGQSRSAERRGAPRCRRSLPGGRRGQGHRDVLRYSERRLKGNTASGWMMRLPRAAPSATTTRRWGSPRAARGNRSSGTSANWGSIPKPPISPWSGSATCRATCLETACCSPATSSSSALSIIAMFFSIPIPIRKQVSKSASGCSTSLALRGLTMIPS